ncbi:Protein phosphatase 2C 35 [Platanthera guangdongensis]|uniref:protein-serine/threonine phosphatase n=1 Tax=Platanthera guangdongensis TaxID=2320717 RepID=A0ABR2LUX2_9ASPA
MGNGWTKLTHCFHPASTGRLHAAKLPAAALEPYDESLGHSFCYVPASLSSSSSSERTTTFVSLSGASVSANTATSLSTDSNSTSLCSASFESSTSFFSVPLQPVGPLSDRGFLSGPIERSYLSGPLDNSTSLHRSVSHSGGVSGCPSSLLSRLSRASAVSPASVDPNIQWAQGKAGEDRVHVVVSRGCIFVGIYDGFNGPDATDYLLSNLYPAVERELNGKVSERHSEAENALVLNSLSRALRETEAAYLNAADKMSGVNPELALMGSCVLVMLMRGKDVYLMNVGDSRAVLGTSISENADSINDGVFNEYGERMIDLRCLSALQLTLDHSTCDQDEVRRIKKEHPDDPSAIANDRVKGYLKVTRAFGAGFLKQPKWNNALLKMFRIDYIGTSPYITCNPSLHHHKLAAGDRFLILSSDGLYQYMTNDEAVAEVELFLAATPEGDPAQHLIEEVLFRAAKKAGMDFHELLEIAQGDRRRYHDDVSVIVISLEGRIWRSCVN